MKLSPIRRETEVGGTATVAQKTARVIETDDDLEYMILEKTSDGGFYQIRKKDEPAFDYFDVFGEDNAAVILPPNYMILDFDDSDHAEKAIQIVEELGLNTRVVRSFKGVHIYFKTERDYPNNTKNELACGLVADIRCGGYDADGTEKRSLARIRRDGIAYDIVQNVPVVESIPLPQFFRPIHKKDKHIGLYGMKDGDSRNDTLYNYMIELKRKGFSKEDVRVTYRLINDYALADRITDSELRTITRDEAYDNIKVGDIDSNTFVDEFRDELGRLPWFEYDKNGNIKKFDHSEFVEALIQKVNIITLHDNVFIYHDGYYRRSEVTIEKQIDRMFPKSRIQDRKEVMSTLRTRTSIDDENTDFYTPDEYVININNGRLDIRTGKLTPHSPEYYDFSRMPITYDPTAESDVIDSMLETVMDGDQELLDLMDEAIGYCLLGSNKYRKGFIFVGDGSNGKSQVLNMLKEFVGLSNFAGVPMEKLQDRFSTSELEHKRLNISDDVTYFKMDETGTLKKLFTGEAFQVENKFEKPFPLTNRAKMFFACNKMPKIIDPSFGMQSRLLFIPFNHTFLMTDENFDPDIGDKLKTPEALSHLLNRGLRGIQRVMANNGFSEPKKSKRMADSYRDENKTLIEKWLEYDEISEDDLCTETIEHWHIAFMDWLSEEGISNVKYDRPSFSRGVTNVRKLENTTGKRDAVGKRPRVFRKREA